VAQLRRGLGIAAALLCSAATIAGGAATATDPGASTEKTALAQRTAAVRQAARAQEAAHPKPVDPAVTRPRSVPDGPPPTGLVELPSPFAAREYVLGAIGWQSVSGDRRLTAYAGRLGDEEAQGVIVIVTTSIPANERQAADVYPAPANGGALRIVGARRGMLLLRDERGETLSFDVSARRFL
jgi:hypothetical protein